MEEIWKDIKGYEGRYQVSNLGMIRNRKGRILKLSLSRKKYGYVKVSLSKNNIQSTYLVHRLVGEAFLPNPDNKPEVGHSDCNRSNNCVDNLYWCTHPENMSNPTTIANMHHQRKDGKAVKPKRKRRGYYVKEISQYTKSGEFVRTWHSMHQIERELKIYHSEISEACKRKRKTAGGYVWRYKDEVA